MRDKINFTEEAIEALVLSTGKTDEWVWDAQRSGLGVRLRAGKTATTKTYYVQYQYGGRDRRDPIGSTSEFTLQDAQHRAYVTRNAAANNVNPQVAKDEYGTESFRQVALSFIEARKRKLRPNTLRGYTRYLLNSDTPYFDPLHALEFKSITKRQIVECLNAIEARSPSAASDARGHLILLYKFAQEQGLVPEGHNPALYTRDPLPKSEMKEIGRALSDDELVAVWRAASQQAAEANDADFGRIVRLALLLGNRRQELGGMKWSELRNGTWHLPAERTKTKFDREIALPALALDIIGTQPASRTYVFGADDKGFSNWSKCKAKLDERLFGKVSSFKLHDLRRTMRTGLDKLGVSEDIAEAAIGHVSKKLVRTYNKHNRVTERAAATNQWAAYIDGLLTNKIVELHAAA